ncbi:hypothetical protein EV715DRAFT_293582 [Schizophyllum commune]
MLTTLVPLALLAASLARASPLEKRGGICDSAPLEEPAVEISQHGDASKVWWVRDTSDYFFDYVDLASAIAIKTKAISTNGVGSLYGRQYTTLPDDTDGEVLANKGFAWTLSCQTCEDDLCLSCGAEDTKVEACTFREPFDGNCITTQANGTLTALPCDGSEAQLYDVRVVGV